MLTKQSNWKTIIFLMVFAIPHLSFANESDTEFFRTQQRQQFLDEHLHSRVDVRLGTDAISPSHFKLGDVETPCMVVNKITLSGEDKQSFAFLIPQLIKRSGFQSGMCIGTQSIRQLQTLAQNIIIEKGFITSQVEIPEQDLNTGSLNLMVISGKVQNIHYQRNEGRLKSIASISSFSNIFPQRRDGILNLRDLEQGLENLRRLPSVTTDIRIEPGSQEGTSDVFVTWAQSRPIRFNVGVDDSGSKITGKYQGNISVSLDNLLGLSDLFYASYSHDLGHKVSYTSPQGVKTKSGTNGYSLHYSVPVGRWLWAWNHCRAVYHEAKEGFEQNYDYNGKTIYSDIGVSRVVFRDGQHKTTIGGKLWSQQIQRYVDDIEIQVQRRRTAGWMIDLQHRAYLGGFLVEGGVAYKRGTGMRRSIKAPEEYNHTHDDVLGTSRMKILSAHASVVAPFQIGQQKWSFDSNLQAQWNRTPLVQQDRLSIGGRYTVRGFDGENSLIGERGWYWQNNLNWHHQEAKKLYVGLDAGRVYGASIQGLPKQQLVGAVVGLKGAHKLGGIVDYDLFMGKPLKKPNGFRTSKTTYGFHLNYSF